MPHELFQPYHQELFQIFPEKLLGPAPTYLRQISQIRGIHSCHSTSILNGWIYQETLTLDEAAKIQNLMIANKAHWFSTQPDLLGNSSVQLFSRDPAEMAEYVQQELGKKAELETFITKKILNMGGFLRNMVDYGYAVVAGNQVHAVLLVSYFTKEDKFRVIDPEFPDKTGFTDADLFASQVLKSDYIVVIK